MTVSEVVKQFQPEGGEFSLAIRGDCSVVVGSMASPVCRIGASDLWLALASSGIVADSIAAKVAEIVIARASGIPLDKEAAEWAKKHSKRAAEIAKIALDKLPQVEYPSTVRVKGEASLA